VGDSIGNLINELTPLLERLLQEEPPRGGGGSFASPGGGPEATPENAGNLAPDLRSSVISSLSKMVATVRELAEERQSLKNEKHELSGAVQTLKDENLALRTECEELRRNRKITGPLQPSTIDASPQSSTLASAIRKANSATEKSPEARAVSGILKQAFKQAPMRVATVTDEAPVRVANWQATSFESGSSTIGSITGNGWMSGDVCDSSSVGIGNADPTSEPTTVSELVMGDVEEAAMALRMGSGNDSALTASARTAALDDHLGKALTLLKLQRTPDDHHDCNGP
jgi:hypothetical protein